MIFTAEMADHFWQWLRSLSRRYFLLQNERPANYVRHAVRVAILAMVLAILLETLPDYKAGQPFLRISVASLNVASFSLLTVDAMGRIVAVWALRFFRSARNCVDCISWSAFLFSFVFPTYLYLWRPIQSLRVLTMFRLSRSFEATDLHIIVRALKTSIRPLRGVFMAISSLIFLSAVAVYYADGGVWNAETRVRMRLNPKTGEWEQSPFQSIPTTMWFSVATLTTTGYGDAIPYYPWSKLWAAVTMILGVMVCCVFVTI